MKTKLLYGLLFTLISSIFCTQANAQQPVGTTFSTGGFTYEITVAGTSSGNSNREVAVIDYLDLNNLTPTIPSTTFYGTTYNVTSIGELAFNSNSLTSVTIPSSVTTIGNYAFNNNSLASITIPSSVINIGNYAFRNNLITSIVIPSSVTIIGDDAFRNNLLTSVVIPPSVTYIGSASFYSNSLTSITIPSSVTTLGDYAFASNAALTEVISESSNPATLLANTFDDNSLIDLTIPMGTTAVYTTANWIGFNSVSATLCTVSIPDANFKAYLVGNSAINTNGDTEIQCSEAAAFSGTIDADNLSITDLTGIETFTALTELNCNNNQLSSLDISSNTALTTVRCYSNPQLNSLDVSVNTDLTYLDCRNNQMSSLDVSANTNLESLYVTNNQLSSLDVSANTALEYLYTANNQLSNLDVSANTTLRYLYCENNQLTSLDVSENVALTVLFCNNNQLSELNVANGNNANMASYAFDALNNPDLTCIQVDNVSYSNTNWTDIDTGIASFSTDCVAVACTINIPDANFKAYLVGNTAINTNGDTEIQCNEASAFNGMINCPSLSIADLTGIEEFTALTQLNCRVNQLTSLDVSQNTALTSLICYGNQLTDLNISQNTDLTVLECNNNELTSLDVSQNTDLTRLYCFDNQLTNLDVSQNTDLTNLNCYSNQLTSLDVSQNTALYWLSCNNNQLTSLDVSLNTTLVELYCYENQLTSLNLANGNNTNMSNSSFATHANPNLTCIQVDDATFSTNTWTNIDATASFSINCGLSINDFNLNSVSISPNPTNSMLNIEMNQDFKQAIIYTVLGKEVLKTQDKNIDVSGLTKGLFLIKIENEAGNVLTKRFIKE